MSNSAFRRASHTIVSVCGCVKSILRSILAPIRYVMCSTTVFRPASSMSFSINNSNRSSGLVMAATMTTLRPSSTSLSLMWGWPSGKSNRSYVIRRSLSTVICIGLFACFG